jgi:hypothetical protein
MTDRRLIFGLFAVAILFSIIHEWSLPTACIRPLLTRTASLQTLPR